MNRIAIIHVSLAALGGVIKTLKGNSGKTRKEIIVSYTSNAITGAFAGVCMFFIASEMGLSRYMIAFLTAIAGWGGNDVLDFFLGIIKKIIGKKID